MGSIVLLDLHLLFDVQVVATVSSAYYYLLRLVGQLCSLLDKKNLNTVSHVLVHLGLIIIMLSMWGWP